MFIQFDENKKMVAIFANSQPDMNLVEVEETQPSEFYIYDLDQKKWILDQEALSKFNQSKKLELFNLSREKINLLTDMVGIMGDESYAPQLTAWRTFQLKLKAITDLTQENIDWPEIPNFSAATEEV